MIKTNKKDLLISILVGLLALVLLNSQLHPFPAAIQLSYGFYDLTVITTCTSFLILSLQMLEILKYQQIRKNIDIMITIRKVSNFQLFIINNKLYAKNLFIAIIPNLFILIRYFSLINLTCFAILIIYLFCLNFIITLIPKYQEMFILIGLLIIRILFYILLAH